MTIDLNNPIHAKAFMLAASHYLSYGEWEEYSAIKLAEVLEDEEVFNSSGIQLWEPFESYINSSGDTIFDLIDNLTFSILNFAMEISDSNKNLISRPIQL